MILAAKADNGAAAILNHAYDGTIMKKSHMNGLDQTN